MFSGSMLISGDVVDLDLGVPFGTEAGFRHPAIVVTAQRVLDGSPQIVHVVPVTSTVRGFDSDVVLEVNGGSGLDRRSVAQCQHLRSVSAARAGVRRGNVGPVLLGQIREVVGLLLDIES